VILPLVLLIAAAAPASTGPADTRTDKARFDACVHLSDSDPAAAAQSAADWARTGGGVAAAQCLGIARSAASDWKGAVDAFSTAAALADQIHDSTASANLWVSAGDAALAGGDAGKARALLTTAIATPGFAEQMKGEAYLDRARADVAAGDLIAARGDMDEAVKLVPADPMAWLLSATLARRMNDQPRAVADIKEAASRAPDNADILDEAGNIAAAGGDTTAARAQWTRALSTEPGSDAAKQARARLAASGGVPATTPAAGR
jgi:tetratricopeptide (TPR) repeat protein